MHRQPSRTTVNMDALDCMADTNDLALDNEIVKHEYDQRSKSRRDPPPPPPTSSSSSKRSNESSGHRSRHSPPMVTHKRRSSPPTNPSSSSSSSSRSHQRHHYPNQRYRIPSRSPSPPPPPPPLAQSSSRHHRPAQAVKRPHSKSRSPYERRPPTNRSRPALPPTERTIGDVLTSIPSAEEPRKSTPKQELADLSLMSEDDSTKTHNTRSNGITKVEPSSTTKLHSTPSVSNLQSKSNDSLLDMSNIPQECELSIFAKSAISTAANASSISTPPSTINPTNDVLQIIDLLSKYKTMESIPNTNPKIDACSKEIFTIIQKQIELQKIELECREREIKLRKREIAEREKHFQEKTNEPISVISVQSEPLIITKPMIIEENIQSKSETKLDQDIKTVTQEEESVAKLPNKNVPEQVSVTRKNHGRSRFSQLVVDPSIFPSHEKPVVDLYADDTDDHQSSSSINSTNPLKKPTISKILAPTDDQLTIIASSNSSFRKVEIQSGNMDKTASKGSSHDLRLTLSKNRTKPSNNDEYQPNGNQPVSENEDEETIKIKSNNDNKQQSHDYQQQRSITSSAIEPIIDNTNDKRDDRRHRQPPQQQQYSSNSNERSYSQGSKYGSNHKRYENDDLRSRIFEQKNPKSSRSTHKNNY